MCEGYLPQERDEHQDEEDNADRPPVDEWKRGRIEHHARHDGHEHEKGEVAGKKILNIKEKPHIPEVDTVTLYVGPHNQKPWYEYILDLSPRRIIFNPGAENQELAEMATERGIEVNFGCTLVMLNVGTF